MKRIAILTTLLAVCVTVGLTALAQAETLIAHYPLSSHAHDVTGNNADMTLTNTPFEQGGIYCNGNYSDPDACNAQTPTLSELDFASFAISAEFKVDEYPAEYTPVFMGGSSYRWMDVYLNPNGTMVMKYNNSNYELTTLPYSLDTWHEAKVTYNAGAGNLYLDGVLAANVLFAINHGNNRNIGISDYGSGSVFKGWFKNLKVYGEVCDPQPLYPLPIQNQLNRPTTIDLLSVWSSGPLATASVNASSFRVSSNMSGPVTGAVSNPSWYQHQFDVSDAFDFFPGEVVTMTLTSDVQCYSGYDLTNGFSSQFTCAVDPNSPGTFTDPANYSAGDYPVSVVAADLDGDGDLDLAAANFDGDDVSVLLNNGAGSFAAAASYSAGSWPRSVFAADLDGDGDLDLATANSDGDNVSVLLNNGAGSFAAAVNYGAGNGPYSVLAADLDGDGDLDLATANAYGGGDDVSVLLNANLSCCIAPIRGNVDNDGEDNIDISDLVYLVDYMFTGGPPPPCLEEADMEVNGEIDISDLVFLVDYMFNFGPPPPACM